MNELPRSIKSNRNIGWIQRKVESPRTAPMRRLNPNPKSFGDTLSSVLDAVDVEVKRRRRRERLLRRTASAKKIQQAS